MTKPVLPASTLCVLAFALASSNVYARPCTADIENTASKIVGDRFFTSWKIRHDAGNDRSAIVYFDYKILYVTARGDTLVERGVFRERVHGQGEQYTKEKISLHGPVEIISVDYENISCRD
jgi:hypothetical protein